jgi:PhoPQ-activated pathogenicity-related protein
MAWLRLFALALGWVVLAGQAARADLAKYLAKPELAYRWKLNKNSDTAAGKTYDLELVSQTWQGITWKHSLRVVLPKKVTPKATMFLWNTGGNPSPRSILMALDMADKMQAPVCFLYGIPNQPLLDGKLREDALIAETFVRYLKTTDDTWPLLFPMVKSLVKAMDALQEFARREWKVEVKSFVVSGASKRGWTTWLTGASDRRVKAIAPLVFDTLNMQKQLPHQLKSYGAYSEMIRDYIRRDLVPPPQTPRGKKLWGLVDPWVYRDRLKLPKLILNGTNDPYWTQDALNLYWDDLEGPRWVEYVPNAGHGLAQNKAGGQPDFERALGTLAAFARAYIHDEPLPKLTWKHTEAADRYRLSVTSNPAPKVVRLWHADAPTRDFRKSTWKEQALRRNKGASAGEMTAPATGCRAFFIECEYETDGFPFFLSTQIRIIGTPKKVSTSSTTETLGVGFGEADITPKVDPKGKSVYLAGFGHNRKATGVHDPLMARAVVLKHEKTKIALVSIDVVGFFHANVERVRKQLPGFSYVLVSSTHNHEGPDTLGLWGASFLQSGIDPDYISLLESRIVKAVKDADGACRPVAASIGRLTAPELLNDNRLPIVKHDELVALQFKDPKKDKTVGVLVQWNCHPETLGSKNTLVSADFVGFTVKHLTKRYDCPVVYLTGTVGGLMTSLGVPVTSAKGKKLDDGTFEKTERYGVLLGEATERALKAAKPITLTPFTIRSRLVDLPLANKAYRFVRTLGVLDRQAYSWNPGGKNEPVEKLEPKKTYAVRTELAYLRLGALEIACIPGEIYPELVLDKVQTPADPGADFPDAPVEPGIYRQMRSPYRMLIGLANDEIGYIIPKRQWDAKPPFCYGRKTAQYGEINSLGPETAPILCQAFKELVAANKTK